MKLQGIMYVFFVIFQQTVAYFTHCSLSCFCLVIHVTDRAKSVKENILILFYNCTVFHCMEVS